MPLPPHLRSSRLRLINRRQTKPRLFCDHDERGRFPPPPVEGTLLLIPIETRRDMLHEISVTGVEYDECWGDGVAYGNTYYYRWLGSPRATVIVVFDETTLAFAGAFKLFDAEVTGEEAAPIMKDVVRAFSEAKFAIDWTGICQ